MNSGIVFSSVGGKGGITDKNTPLGLPTFSENTGILLYRDGEAEINLSAPLTTELARKVNEAIHRNARKAQQYDSCNRVLLLWAYARSAWKALGYQDAEEMFKAEYNLSFSAWYRQVQTAIFEMHVIGGLSVELVELLQRRSKDIPEDRVSEVIAALPAVGTHSERAIRPLREGPEKIPVEYWRDAYEELTTVHGEDGLTGGVSSTFATEFHRRQKIKEVSPALDELVRQEVVGLVVAEQVVQALEDCGVDERVHEIVARYGVTDPAIVHELARLAKRGRSGSPNESDTLRTILETGCIDGDEERPITTATHYVLRAHLEEARRYHYLAAVEQAAHSRLKEANRSASILAEQNNIPEPTMPQARSGAFFVESLEQLLTIPGNSLGCYLPNGESAAHVGYAATNHGLRFLAVLAFREQQAPTINDGGKAVTADRLYGRLPAFLEGALLEGIGDKETARRISRLRQLAAEDDEFVQAVIVAASNNDLRRQIIEMAQHSGG